MSAPDTRHLTMKNVLPFWGRATLMDSPVDEATRESGLIVPLTAEAGTDVKRGVLLALDEHWDNRNEGYRICDQIHVGMVVYYKGGIKIGDVIVVEMNQIIAYEGDDERHEA